MFYILNTSLYNIFISVILISISYLKKIRSFARPGNRLYVGLYAHTYIILFFKNKIVKFSNNKENFRLVKYV